MEMTSRSTVFLACEYSHFSLLLATKDVSPGGLSSWRNVPGGEELGETAVLTGLSFSGSNDMKLPPASKLLNGRSSL